MKEFGEGIDRICRELSEQGTQEPQYNLVAFIMRATVCASTAKEEPAVNEHPENSETNGANNDTASDTVNDTANRKM